MFNLIHNFSNKKCNQLKGICNLKKDKYFIHDVQLPGEAYKYLISIYEYDYTRICRKNNINTWKKYIAKFGAKWYPCESLTEYLISVLGQKMGFNVAKSRLFTIKGYLFFCSEYFLNDNENLFHGADIIAEYLNVENEYIDKIDYEGLSQELLTFQEIQNAIQNKYPDNYKRIIQDFCEMLLFDCILGINDRHFYNWGVIENEATQEIRFSPIFDSSRGLFWNIADDNLNESKIEKYAEKSMPKIGWEKRKYLNHFDLFELLLKNGYIEVNSLYLHTENIKNLLDALFQTKIFQNFSSKRQRIIKKYILYRVAKLKQICSKI